MEIDNEMPSIDWSSFSWEAFATLVTGLAAVGAATYVGRKQVEIAARQAAILDMQVTLDELKLRSELFERRFAVYQATAKLLAEVMRSDAPASAETEREFLRAFDQSRFLFRPAVYEGLEAIWKTYTNYGAVRNMIGAGAHQANYQELVEAKARMLTNINERLRDLSTLFGDELRLAVDSPTVALPAHPA